ncbi:MAG: DUF1015 domain-containing protein [Verrucomicrobia subdivision 3 bacterium]|nr:DUF1015 domain-containing protein [Limisphaerales bacterium]
MATLKPFAALRPKSDLAAKICELPYDVMNSAEARAIAKDNPFSFLHVSKPEIDLELNINVYSPPVYAKGAENFGLLQGQGALVQDAQPCFYLYRQVMDGHTQTGLVAAASCAEYDAGIIKKHELTRPAKEDDRVRHLEALSSQTGPVFLTYRATADLDALAERLTANEPAIHLTADDGVQHTAWVIDNADDIASIEAQFAAIDFLYIADGHHRSAAASRVCATRNGAGESGRFLTVVFPHNQMQILAYNRVIKDLNGQSSADFLAALGIIFDIQDGGAGECTCKNELGLYLDGQWRKLTFKPTHATAETPMDELDVALLQNHVLAPLLGIEDQRTSDRLDFIGGIRGTAELERLVDAGAGCAFSMFPTSIEDLMAIADADGLMPPKSTWFEPKLRDGLFCHMI